MKKIIIMRTAPASKVVEEEKVETQIPPPKKKPVKLLKKMHDYRKWSGIARDIVGDKYQVVYADDANRVDIVDPAWRISVIGMLNEEFCCNLYINYTTECTSLTMIKVEHIILAELEKTIKFQLDNINKFRRKK